MSLKPNNTTCDDGNHCTFSDVCVNGTCAGTAYACLPPNECQTAACDGNGGCVNNAKTDETSCSNGGKCCGGVCVDEKVDDTNCGKCGTVCCTCNAGSCCNTPVCCAL